MQYISTCIIIYIRVQFMLFWWHNAISLYNIITFLLLWNIWNTHAKPVYNTLQLRYIVIFMQIEKIFQYNLVDCIGRRRKMFCMNEFTCIKVSKCDTWLINHWFIYVFQSFIYGGLWGWVGLLIKPLRWLNDCIAYDLSSFGT